MTTTVSDNPTKSSRNNGAQRSAGRDFYRTAIARGEKPTADDIGSPFGRSAAWGQNRIREVEQELAAPLAERVSPAAAPIDELTDRIAPNGTPRPVEAVPIDIREPHPAPTQAAALDETPPAAPPATTVSLATAGEPRSGADGKTYAMLGLIAGIVASIAANVMHSMIQGPAGLPELIYAGFWPCALFITIEVLIRVRWLHGAWWWITRFVGVGVVGLVVATVSYRHMQGLLASWGEGPFNSHAGPIGVDGLMLVCATALLAISRQQPASPGR